MSVDKILTPTKFKRYLFFLISDAIIFAFSFYTAFLLRFEFDISERYLNIITEWVILIVISKLIILSIFKAYNFNWQFVGINEVIKTVLILFGFSILLFLIDIPLQDKYVYYSIPKSVIFIDFFISAFLVSLLRISKRLYLENLSGNKGKKGTIIIGAGNTGERIVRELKKHPEFKPVFFIDDDKMKIGTKIHNIPVLGSIKDLPSLLKESKVDSAIIAIPSLTHKEIKEIFDLLVDNGISDIKVVPSISKLPKNIISIKDLKDISIEDLLSREPIRIEENKVRDFLENRTIFVSGAGGSIGSEIVKQLIKFNPKCIVAFEIDETEIYNLSLKINEIIKNKNKNIRFIPIVGDIRDKEKLKKVFEKYKPDVVFHAAAYKHVPLMEEFPEESIKTNIFGTYNIATVSIENNVEKFINISTDKAVNPSSIMGATKRLAEIICSTLNELDKTKFISVRFGNVLGSRGSVIPIFLEQIKKGGPVTVTHPEMRRYFMTIPEAVLLVFQAATIGKGGEVLVLDMGEPIKILHLAEELIKLQGLEPYKDIKIVFTGLRPGEKLFEELLTAEEGTLKTTHEKVFIAKISQKLSLSEIESLLKLLEDAVEKEDRELIRKILESYVPFYKKEN